MYKGSCLCGQICFEITSSINNIVYCHCSKCRKAQGSAFATNGIVDAKAFNISQGESELTAYKSNAEQTKYFCKHCGSPIMSKSSTKIDQVRIRLGTIESDITERPVAHIFVDSKASWEDINDDLPHYKTYEPNR